MRTTKTTFLSKKGFKELKKKISRLERERQDMLLRLRELDKTDNHEEQLARTEQLAAIEAVESELYDSHELLKSARPFPRRRDALKVAVGSAVDLLDTNGHILRYTIVESIEANPSDGRISALSPLGKSLLGKQLKDIVEWTAAMGTRRLQLISIH